jgi:hypothetical protein
LSWKSWGTRGSRPFWDSHREQWGLPCGPHWLVGWWGTETRDNCFCQILESSFHPEVQTWWHQGSKSDCRIPSQTAWRRDL